MTSAVQSVVFLSILNDSTSSSIWRSTPERNPSCVRSAAELLDRRRIWWDFSDKPAGHFLIKLFPFRSNMWRPTGQSRGGWRTPCTVPALRERSRSPSSRESSSSEPGGSERFAISTNTHNTKCSPHWMLSTLYLYIYLIILFISI